ncbi:replication factor C large subunit [Thermofilum pendens]|uniref:Replication factor C large subunit n=1 Tax=Thermofilum pendens (strain DSM 2475 / Hrk 5) TaxID=368408 RepID=RFCL_THEPD|nr:replication factor C large subunit [Thermofilum pendens]A1RWU6.1 RecName: Full=Replication factor C large subunit; Short=RFC large subunit; AltName: Full=Clamp loader large subunit [Thermofilum pendens Hrk 5]ABL77676.1 replication factor C large subunit [Thermofilum pendens Hrk 5]
MSAVKVQLVPWTEKYRPARIADVVGNEEAKKKYVAWINSWVKGKPSKKAALLYGPPGSGKTSIVHATAKEFSWELIELNASDVRTREALQQRLLGALNTRSVLGYSGKIILLDEVDGISTKEDAGGLQAIVELIEKSNWPIVLTANDPWDPKLRPLRDLCELIEFKKIGKRDIMKVLENICSKEGVECSREVLSAIADNAKGDLRAAINDLQSLAMGKKTISLADLQILGDRAEQETIFDIVRSVLTAKYPEQALAVTRLPSLDYEMLMQWLSENIVYQYEPSLQAIADAYDALSWADIMLTRMKREQQWALLSYALELMTAGVASARERPPFKFVKYSFPEKLRILARSKEKREKFVRAVRGAAAKIHVSTSKFRTDVLPYLRVIYEHDKKRALEILRNLGVPEDALELATQ